MQMNEKISYMRSLLNALTFHKPVRFNCKYLANLCNFYRIAIYILINLYSFRVSLKISFIPKRRNLCRQDKNLKLKNVFCLIFI